MLDMAVHQSFHTQREREGEIVAYFICDVLGVSASETCSETKNGD